MNMRESAEFCAMVENLTSAGVRPISLLAASAPNESKSNVVQEIIRERKAAHLLKLHTDQNSLDALSAATEKEIETASAVTQENTVLAGAGIEPYVIGTAFAMELNQPSILIEGNNGVYMIEVTSKEIAEELSNLTVLEASELSKILEEKWGVSAAAPVAAPAASPVL